MPAIIVPHALAQPAVVRSAAEALDPAVLVRGRQLRGQLTPDPIRLLGQDGAAAGFGNGECRGAAADARASDQDIGGVGGRFYGSSYTSTNAAPEVPPEPLTTAE